MRRGSRERKKTEGKSQEEEARQKVGRGLAKRGLKGREGGRVWKDQGID